MERARKRIRFVLRAPVLLPWDVWLTIVAHVGYPDPRDQFRLRLVCRRFARAVDVMKEWPEFCARVTGKPWPWFIYALRRYWDKPWDHWYVCRNRGLTWEFLDAHLETLPYEYMCHNKNITYEIYKQNEERLQPYINDFWGFCGRSSWPVEERIKLGYRPEPWDLPDFDMRSHWHLYKESRIFWRDVSAKKTLDLDFVMEHRDQPWEWDFIADNAPESFIEEHLHVLPWKLKNGWDHSDNCTLAFYKRHPEIPWQWTSDQGDGVYSACIFEPHDNLDDIPICDLVHNFKLKWDRIAHRTEDISEYFNGIVMSGMFTWTNLIRDGVIDKYGHAEGFWDTASTIEK